MNIIVTAEYYNRLKMAGLIVDDVFIGFEGIEPVPIRHRNKHQMPEGVLMQMVEA